jgi:hypothetical protein
MPRSLPIRLRTVAAAVVVIASGMIIWNAYQSIINSTDPAGVLPIIKADSEPFRVLPDDPGGLEIPNQGSELFKVLNPENGDNLALDGVRIEEDEPETIAINDNIDGIQGFQLPEIPEAQSESLYSDISQLKDIEEIENDPELIPLDTNTETDLKEKLQSAIEKAEEKQTEITQQEPEQEIEKQEVQNQDFAVNDLLPIPMQKPKSIASAQRDIVAVNNMPSEKRKDELKKEFSLDRILAQTPSQNRHYIQLASLKSEAVARDTYRRIRDDFPSLVEGVSVFYPRADLGSRGVFYRVQIGPLSATEAKARCADYTSSSRGGTCLVVSR